MQTNAEQKLQDLVYVQSQLAGSYAIPNTAYLVSLVPILPEHLGRFKPGEIPWLVEQDFKYGGITRIQYPAAQRGKIIHRRIDANKLQGAMPRQGTPQALLWEQPYWYQHDVIKDLPDAKANGYTVIQIFDSVQFTIEPNSQMMVPRPIPAMVIAEAMADSRKSVKMPAGTLGIGHCELEESIPSLVKELTRIQTECFAALIMEGNTLHGAAKYDQIHGYHRMAADWMGMADLPWRKPIAPNSKKSCLLCALEIPAQALACPNCKLLPTAYLEAIIAGINLDLTLDPVVKPHVDRMMKENFEKTKRKGLGA